MKPLFFQEVSHFLDGQTRSTCINCRRSGGCSLPSQASGYLTSIRIHRQAHPDSADCLQCGKWYDDLEGVYRRISDCPDKG